MISHSSVYKVLYCYNSPGLRKSCLLEGVIVGSRLTNRHIGSGRKNLLADMRQHLTSRSSPRLAITVFLSHPAFMTAGSNKIPVLHPSSAEGHETGRETWHHPPPLFAHVTLVVLSHLLAKSPPHYGRTNTKPSVGTQDQGTTTSHVRLDHWRRNRGSGSPSVRV